MSKRAGKHDHAEAFHLMMYQCESSQCGFIEYLWNTRDGVTPFCLDCVVCGDIAQHVYFGSDQYIPDFVDVMKSHKRLNYAVTRVFVDSQPSMVEKQAREYVERWWELEPALGGGTMKAVFEAQYGYTSKEQVAEHFVKEWTKDKGSPAVISLAEYLKLSRL